MLAGIVKYNLKSFKDVLSQIHNEFSLKINKEKFEEYLTRDVIIGKNIFVRTVPLFLKKIAIRLVLGIANMTSTSTLSNVGIIDIENKYKKYIDNVFVLVMPNNNEKIKCTVCSFNDKLNITINSNINDIKFQHTFLSLLKKEISNVKLVSNTKLFI